MRFGKIVTLEKTTKVVKFVEYDCTPNSIQPLVQENKLKKD